MKYKTETERYYVLTNLHFFFSNYELSILILNLFENKDEYIHWFPKSYSKSYKNYTNSFYYKLYKYF